METVAPLEIKLKVMEAVQDDVNRGVVKIDSSFMKQIGVAPGDAVEIKGERVTGAIADRAYPGDIGLNIIRMDGNIRRNARTSIGEIVTVRKADIKIAKKVIIAPATKGVMIKAAPQLFKQGLLGKVVAKGDIVSLGRGRKRTHYQGSADVNDIFSMMESQFAGFGFGDLKFVVVDTNPRKEVVIIANETEVEFNPQAVELKEEEGLNLGVNYEDIGGLKEEIKKVREMVELPLKHPEIFEKLGIEAPKGVLLHGPPGTGKTLLAKAVASETNSHFIVINGPEVISKFYGESEANLRKKFEEAEQNAPSIIFFDEIDAIATKREETRGDVEKRVVAQLLGLMDGLKSRGKVIVLAATNMPNSLDIALRRPGRFDREIEIGVPDKEGRLDILKIHTRNMPLKGSLYGDIILKLIPEVIENKIFTLNNEISKKESKIGDCLLKISQFNSEIKDQEELIKTYNLEIKEKENSIKLLQQEIKELEVRKEKSDQSLIYRILEKITGLDRNITAVKNRIDILKKEIIASLNQIKNSNSQISDLNNLITLTKQEQESIKEEIIPINVLKKQILTQESDLRNLAEEIKKMEDVKFKLSLNDPRRTILENNLSSYYKDIEKLQLISFIVDNARKEGVKRDLFEIARITHGFVGADLNMLAKEAAMIVLRHILPDLKLEGVNDEDPIPQDILEKLVIMRDDFVGALKVVRPSAMREVLVETPDVNWDDVGGLEDTKEKLKEAVEWPLNKPEIFETMGIRPPRGILLYGAPGTGKTLLAKAVAKESEANFILINGPSLLSKWVGDSEKAMREVFRKARQTSPTILFFDEIDALVPRRGAGNDSGGKVNDKMVNQMLTEMDGLEVLKDVVVIAATNRPEIVDPALLRQGRFDRIIYIPIPDLASRKKIFDVYLECMKIDYNNLPKKNVKLGKTVSKIEPESYILESNNKEITKNQNNDFFENEEKTEFNIPPEKKKKFINLLAEKTEGYVGADIEGVCREAAMIALRENINAKEVRMEHFTKALDLVRPSINKETEDYYIQLKESYFSSARAKQIKEEKVAYFG